MASRNTSYPTRQRLGLGSSASRRPSAKRRRDSTRLRVERHLLCSLGLAQGRVSSSWLRCMRDSVMRGEAPFASHLLYVQFLDDDILWEREAGLSCGFAWGALADATVVYTDP